MAHKVFGTKWRSCINACLASSHFNILINGTPKSFLPASRGGAQTRGPFISLLFTLVADAFNQIVLGGEGQNLYKGF